MTSRTTTTRIALAAAVLALSLVLVPLALAGKGGGHAGTGGSGKTGGDPGCSVAPGSATLDQVWTVSAFGLPTSSTVNRIITFPDGSQSTGPITVSSDGTYTTTGSSDMSASWGFIAPEQIGTYTYQFVGRVKWPEGTFTKLYAECSVSVTS